ncbi:glycosyltransferase family 4 protein [Shewanella sp.]|uniref:glycosyltransferase family 4 protein n=1 Tax=Shewanella sp. TaxID=50422 RepID=UPI003A97FAED
MIIIDGIIETLQSSGGITTYFSELIKNFENSNVEYKYLNYVGSKSKLKGTVSDDNLKRFLERYRDVPFDCDSTPRIFHSSYYRIPQPKSSKVVTTVHDFTYERFVGGLPKKVHTWQKYRAIKNSDIVICVSNSTAKDLMEYCPIDESKIRVIYNGVSDSYYKIDTLHDADKTNQKNVLFVGSRAAYKNFDLAVKTLANLPDLTLDIVGGGILSSAELEFLNNNLSGRFNYLGRLTDQELNLAYNKCYALFYPSSYEGFGIPIIEAMQSGCPVICVNSSSIPEVAGDAAIVVNGPSVSEFKLAFEKLPSIRTSLIEAGFKQAEKFSWNKCFRETLGVYRELL